jgi:hypothetical protein
MSEQPTDQELRAAYMAAFTDQMPVEELRAIREKRTTWEGRPALILRNIIDKLIESIE